MPIHSPDQYQSGDICLCHSHGIIGFLIRLAQWIRWRDWYRENHVAVLDKWDDVEQDWTIIQAVAHGVTNNSYLSTVSPKRGGSHIVLPFPSGANRDNFLEFMRDQVGAKYGYFTILSIAANLLTPKWVKFDIRKAGSWICSAVTAGGFWFAGWNPMIWTSDLYQITPAEIYALLTTAQQSPTKDRQ